jgi:hypothetical protein
MGAQGEANGDAGCMTNAIIISGFICVGKTYLAKQFKDAQRQYNVIDLDSNQFSGARIKHLFPANYFDAIRKAVFADDGDPRPKIILLSTHAECRVMLAELKIPYALVYPHVSLEKTWMERISGRDAAENRPFKLGALFKAPPREIETEKSAFSVFATQCGLESGGNLRHYVLQPHEYLGSVLDKILKDMGGHETRWPFPQVEEIQDKNVHVRAVVRVRNKLDGDMSSLEKEYNSNWGERVENAKAEISDDEARLKEAGT